MRGDWTGSYGADGYALLGWHGTSDMVALPQATLSFDQGYRYVFGPGGSDVRALERADQSERRAACMFHGTSLRLHLTFSAAYSGTLHLYAVDWDDTIQRQTVTVSDGASTTSVSLASNFHDGAWMHVPINVAAGGVVNITADRVAGNHALLSGLFLGGAGTPPSSGPPPAWESGLRGDWVGSYGADGHALLAWNGSSDVVSLPNATISLLQGSRSTFASSTSDLRALEDPTQATRRARIWQHSSSLRLQLTFSAAYSGTMHLYGVDWNGTSRRQTVIIDAAGTLTTVNVDANFHEGAWIHVPISVPSGGVVTITVNRTAGSNAVLSGVFLGN